MEKLTRFRYALTLVPILILFGGCHKKQESPATTEVTVLVAPAGQADVPVVRQFVGSIEGLQNAKIQARVVGYLQSQDYKEGSVVQQGSVLFKIDPRPFEAALSQAQANLAQAQAKAQLAESTLARQQQLYKTNVISAQEFDASTQTARADIAVAQAATANVESAKLNLEYCTITAPFTGIAGKAQAQIGDLVGTGSNMVLTEMSELDHVKVNFPISEQAYLQVAPRIAELENVPLDERPKNFEIVLADGLTYPKRGVFDFANLDISGTTGTIGMTALFPNQDNILRPGQYAKVKLTAEVLKDAVVIPQRAVNELQGTYYQIAVVKPDDTIEIRIVEVGVRSGSDWVISSGLKAGEMVVVEGIQKLQNGMKVKTQPYTAPTPQPTPTPEISKDTDIPSPPPSPTPAATPVDASASPTPTGN